MKRTFYEFFAGGGMARAGLGPDWECLFANDFDPKKAAAYRANWGDGELVVGDVAKLSIDDMPGTPDLVWASFPCQDLSLAGVGAGLRGERSGAFWPFWRHMENLVAGKRAPEIIALENVCGTLTSHGGEDFEAICRAYDELGYRFGAMVIDAALFVPQSRPRLFMVGVARDIDIPADLFGFGLDRMGAWQDRRIKSAYGRLPDDLRRDWLWWNLPIPPRRNTIFADLIEENPRSVDWHDAATTNKLFGSMSDVNLAKVEEAKRSGRKMVGAIYKRTRRDAAGDKIQRAEIRFDDVAGCLRTPAGGSSRQLIMVVEGESVRTRLISARETARLMGLADNYKLPDNYNEAYHLTGDGVVVPVVRYLANRLFSALTRRDSFSTADAA